MVLFVGAYDDVATALQDLAAFEQLHDADVIGDYDAAVVDIEAGSPQSSSEWTVGTARGRARHSHRTDRCHSRSRRSERHGSWQQRGSPMEAAPAMLPMTEQARRTTRMEEVVGQGQGDNVVVVRFPELVRAQQAMSELDRRDTEGRIKVNAATIVERRSDGRLRVPEETDIGELSGTVSGAFLGMLIGAFEGPLGVFLGWSAGALFGWGSGALFGDIEDLRKTEEAEDALTALGTSIRPGSCAIVASVSEPTTEVIDEEMAKLSGEVTRRPIEEVMAELEAAEEAAAAAAKEARRVMRERRKARVTAEFEERITKLQNKLSVA